MERGSLDQTNRVELIVRYRINQVFLRVFSTLCSICDLDIPFDMI